MFLVNQICRKKYIPNEIMHFFLSDKKYFHAKVKMSNEGNFKEINSQTEPSVASEKDYQHCLVKSWEGEIRNMSKEQESWKRKESG